MSRLVAGPDASPLRAWRVGRGLRVTDVARAVRMLPQFVSRLERGCDPLNAPRLARMAAFYGVRPEVLAQAMAAWHAGRAGPEGGA